MSVGEPSAELELAEVYRKRYREARRAGMSRDDAKRYAGSDAETGQLRRLVDAGCPSHLLLRLLL